MKKTKVYISSYMTGVKDNNRPAFERKAAQLERLGYEVLNPSNIELKYPKRDYKFYLREAVKTMLNADIILFFGKHNKRFNLSYGVCVEREIAERLSIPSAYTMWELKRKTK